MPLDMTKLNMIAAEWDPEPFLKAIDQMPTGAMDMTGSSSQPLGPAASGMDFASIFGGATPAQMAPKGPVSPGPIPQPQMPQIQQMPGANRPGIIMPVVPQMPQQPGMIQTQGRVPTLAELLGGSSYG